MRKLFIGLIMCVSLLAASCAKTCECKRYDGGVDTYDIEDLNAEGMSCADKELLYFGRLYITCDRVL